MASSMAAALAAELPCEAAAGELGMQRAAQVPNHQPSGSARDRSYSPVPEPEHTVAEGTRMHTGTFAWPGTKPLQVGVALLARASVDASDVAAAAKGSVAANYAAVDHPSTSDSYR